MPKVTESGLENPVEIRIRVVRNGVEVEGSRSDTNETMEYVYSSLKKALKEIPGLVSVLSDEPKKVSEKDLDEEEERINGKEEY